MLHAMFNRRNMGHWRLMFQFAFADMLGYKYLWQVDDDTEFKSQEAVNITEFMQEKLVAGASCSLPSCPQDVCAAYALCSTRASVTVPTNLSLRLKP
jgi:hypothetical protein